MISDDAERILCAKYPEFFNVGANGQFGFECGAGWLGILETLCERLSEARTQDNIERFRILQIKEKFGTLRVYHSSTNPTICKHVHCAEEMSSTVCEVCGASGRLIFNGGWQRTRCANHAAPPPRYA